MTHKEVLIGLADILKQIENGEAVATCVEPARLEDHLHDCFSVDKWTFSIFDDNGSWDYVNSVTAPDGTFFDYYDINTLILDLDEDGEIARCFVMNYEPPPNVWTKVYEAGINAMFFARKKMDGKVLGK